MKKNFLIGLLIVGIILVGGYFSYSGYISEEEWEIRIFNETMHISSNFTVDCYLLVNEANLSPSLEYDINIKKMEGNNVSVCCGVKRSEKPLSYGNCLWASCVIYNTETKMVFDDDTEVGVNKYDCGEIPS